MLLKCYLFLYHHGFSFPRQLRTSGMAPLVSSAKLDGRRMVWYVLLVALSCSQAHGSQMFTRKELDFERMGERDRKQIVAEVCVLVKACSLTTD
jgi:hypothetical protein